MPPGGSLKSFEGYHITNHTLRLYYKKKNVGRFYDVAMMMKQSLAADTASPSELAGNVGRKGDTTCIKGKSYPIELLSQEDMVLRASVSSTTQAGGHGRK